MQPVLIESAAFFIVMFLLTEQQNYDKINLLTEQQKNRGKNLISYV